ncbi:sialinsialin-like [Octopus vulgaris]|uniref:Sialin n=1 Tax=Octopus vulgaris TaxID=6645 RepID=A0AA36FGW5_OCTVU|nr:sialinsialin-like [Octopus vulgaris]
MDTSSQELDELCDKRSSLRRSYSEEMTSSTLANPFQKPCCCCYIPKRYILACMAFLGFANIYSLRVILSVAMVAINSNITADNETSMDPEFHYDSELQGMILSSFFYGYIVTQLPGGFIANRFGGKYVFGGGVFITAILNLFTPLCIHWNLLSLVILRIFEGLFEGITYPSIHALWAKWAPPLEKTKLATIAFSGSYFGTVISLPISGVLAKSSLGWPSIFYFWGTVAIVWFLFWCYLVSESPSDHRYISQEELEFIQHSIGYGVEQTKNLKPPWVKILSSIPVWAIVIAHFAENWGFYTWLTELPAYMHNILKYDIQQTGFIAALPYLVMGFVVLGAGQLADFLRSTTTLSTTVIRKMFTCSAFVAQAIMMTVAGYLMTREAAVTCITVGVGIGGFAWAGFSVNHLDIAPQYASILMGVSNTFATLPGIISPSITGHVVSHQLAAEWRIIFYIAAAIYLIGGMVYAISASGERQRWAETPSGYLPYDDLASEREQQ